MVQSVWLLLFLCFLSVFVWELISFLLESLNLTPGCSFLYLGIFAPSFLIWHCLDNVRRLFSFIRELSIKLLILKRLSDQSCAKKRKGALSMTVVIDRPKCYILIAWNKLQKQGGFLKLLEVLKVHLVYTCFANIGHNINLWNDQIKY